MRSHRHHGYYLGIWCWWNVGTSEVISWDLWATCRATAGLPRRVEQKDMLRAFERCRGLECWTVQLVPCKPTGKFGYFVWRGGWCYPVIGLILYEDQISSTFLRKQHFKPVSLMKSVFWLDGCVNSFAKCNLEPVSKFRYWNTNPWEFI